MAIFGLNKFTSPFSGRQVGTGGLLGRIQATQPRPQMPTGGGRTPQPTSGGAPTSGVNRPIPQPRHTYPNPGPGTGVVLPAPVRPQPPPASKQPQIQAIMDLIGGPRPLPDRYPGGFPAMGPGAPGGNMFGGLRPRPNPTIERTRSKRI